MGQVELETAGLDVNILTLLCGETEENKNTFFLSSIGTDTHRLNHDRGRTILSFDITLNEHHTITYRLVELRIHTGTGRFRKCDAGLNGITTRIVIERCAHTAEAINQETIRLAGKERCRSSFGTTATTTAGSESQTSNHTAEGQERKENLFHMFRKFVKGCNKPY